MPFFYVDWYYIVLVLPAVILSLWASAHVKSTFRRYSQVRSARGMTGAEAAMAVLRAHGVTDVRVEHVSGDLTDHFDPKDHVIRLSDSVYNVATPAAVGVAAHEAGHAVQYARHYAPIYIRAAIVPVTNIGSRLSMPLIVLGLALSGLGQVFYYVALAGVACYGLCVVFQLVTLPTEFNASHRALRAIDYASPMASAQLKTAVLLAGVFADGTTTVNEPAPSRNHTELMLPEFNVPTTAGTRVATVTGPAEMLASDVVVPGDPSSAAFVAAAALLKPGSSVTIQNVSLNPARIGFVRTLERMGADIRESYGGHEGKEPRGTITVNYTPVLRGCEIPSQHIASVIDEIPVLALVAAHARGITVFHKVGELRVKESDRLKAIIDGLALLGVDAWEEGDDLFVEGNPQLQVPQGLVFESYGDHRLAMTWALVGACGRVPVSVTRFTCVAVSYPDFLADLKGLVK